MGAASLGALLYTHGDVRTIVVMYSINVFLTFTLSMAGMLRAEVTERGPRPGRAGRTTLFVVGLAFCATILAVTVHEKFGEGGWITLAVTFAVVLGFFGVRRHYRALDAKLSGLFTTLLDLPPTPEGVPAVPDPSKPAAIVLVGGYSGLGVHTTLGALRAFPGQFQSVVFVSVGVLDSTAFKTEDAMDAVRARVRSSLDRYVGLAKRMGLPAEARSAIGTDVVLELEKLCLGIARDYAKVTVFAGQLVFERSRWLRSLLHNETAFALQRRLQLAGLTMVILPARVE
jgi:hypothetical protein